MTDLERGTSEWWLDRLGKRMSSRALELQRFDDYYTGAQGKRFIRTDHRELFAKFFERYCENFCGVVVDAVAERLEVQGFRFPRPGADGETPAVSGEARDTEEADEDAWRIWQDNQLDAWSQIAHTEMFVKGIVYVLVSPFEAEFVGERSPRITVEDACQTIVEIRPGTGERVVGMKRWVDEVADTYFATLYYPDRIEKWQADGRHTVNSIGARYQLGERINWKRREVPGEAWPLPHSLGVVPLVPLVNRPRLNGQGQSELEQVIPIQDAINTISLNELVASDAAAFPQKWATGIEIPTGKDGKPLEPWKPDVERILSTAVPDAKFGSFAIAELANWGESVDRKVKRIASITRTPYHYFLDHGGQPPSGDSIKSSETGLVRKSGKAQLHTGEGWEEVERLAFKARGDERAEILDSETIWAPIETMSESEHVDALVKMKSLRVADEILWERWGMSPQEIERNKTLVAEQELANPTPPPPPATPTLEVVRPDGATTTVRPASQQPPPAGTPPAR